MLKYLVLVNGVKRLKINKLLLSIIFIFYTGISYAENTAEQACENAGVSMETLMDIQTAAFETIDNMLPIKVGGIEVDDIDDANSALGGGSSGGGDSSTFICLCQAPPPIFERAGISISFWNNVGMMDTTTIPYCFPQLGMSMSFMGDAMEGVMGALKPGMGGSNQFGKRSGSGKQKGDQYLSAHTHFSSYLNLMKIISEAIFSMCFTADTATNIAPQMSEVFFWWQEDTWAVLKNPEAFLVANPIATAACMAESLTMIALYNLDPLFWCVGTWGSLYPISMNVGSGMPLAGHGMLVARNLAERFQLGMLLDTTGYQMLNGICQPIPIYFTPKNDVNIFPVFPQKKSDRFPLGMSSELWGIGMDNPTNLGVMTWMVYQKKDCCYL